MSLDQFPPLTETEDGGGDRKRGVEAPIFALSRNLLRLPPRPVARPPRLGPQHEPTQAELEDIFFRFGWLKIPKNRAETCKLYAWVIWNLYCAWPPPTMEDLSTQKPFGQSPVSRPRISDARYQALVRLRDGIYTRPEKMNAVRAVVRVHSRLWDAIMPEDLED